jgi:hypothetical protein
MLRNLFRGGNAAGILETGDSFSENFQDKMSVFGHPGPKRARHWGGRRPKLSLPGNVFPRKGTPPHPPMKASALLTIAAFGISGCASPTATTKEPGDVAVSVSAANYSKLSDEELYASVNAPANTHPEVPAGSVAMKPIYYLMVPGEVYSSDVPMDRFYSELELVLEQRRYFNVIYQMRAGHKPAKIDEILRVHYGGRTWLTPTVRSDRITWGNDGIVSNRYMTSLLSNSLFDPRVGLSSDEIASVRELFSMPKVSKVTIGAGEGPRAFTPAEMLPPDAGMGAQAAQDFCLLVVEAFRLDDIIALDKKAPCIWCTFIAVPVDRGQKFSSVLPAMLKTAEPYFGTTTNGMQVYEVPNGKVILGNPVELPGRQKAVEPGNMSNPAVHMGP